MHDGPRQVVTSDHNNLVTYVLEYKGLQLLRLCLSA